MKTLDPSTPLRIRPRPSELVSIRIPVDALAALQRVAERRDMSVEALLRLYIGSGLREDIADQFSERLIETTAEVLHRRLASQAEATAILAEIREASALNR